MSKTVCFTTPSVALNVDTSTVHSGVESPINAHYPAVVESGLSKTVCSTTPSASNITVNSEVSPISSLLSIPLLPERLN